jgi:hypothetical protein
LASLRKSSSRAGAFGAMKPSWAASSIAIISAGQPMTVQT